MKPRIRLHSYRGSEPVYAATVMRPNGCPVFYVVGLDSVPQVWAALEATHHEWQKLVNRSYFA